MLERILERKKAELRRKANRGYLSSLKAKIADRPDPLNFCLVLEEACTPDSPCSDRRGQKSVPESGNDASGIS